MNNNVTGKFVWYDETANACGIYVRKHPYEHLRSRVFYGVTPSSMARIIALVHSPAFRPMMHDKYSFPGFEYVSIS